MIRNSPPGHLTSGVIKEDVKLSIQMCVENDALSIKNKKMCEYLCLLSADKMALKPALEYSPPTQSVIGLVEPEHLKYKDVTELCE